MITNGWVDWATRRPGPARSRSVDARDGGLSLGSLDDPIRSCSERKEGDGARLGESPTIERLGSQTSAVRVGREATAELLAEPVDHGLIRASKRQDGVSLRDDKRPLTIDEPSKVREFSVRKGQHKVSLLLRVSERHTLKAKPLRLHSNGVPSASRECHFKRIPRGCRVEPLQPTNVHLRPCPRVPELPSVQTLDLVPNRLQRTVERGRDLHLARAILPHLNGLALLLRCPRPYSTHRRYP